MAAAILDLFETGTPNIDRHESLAIRRILDVAATAGALTRYIAI